MLNSSVALAVVTFWPLLFGVRPAEGQKTSISIGVTVVEAPTYESLSPEQELWLHHEVDARLASIIQKQRLAGGDSLQMVVTREVVPELMTANSGDACVTAPGGTGDDTGGVQILFAARVNGEVESESLRSLCEM